MNVASSSRSQLLRWPATAVTRAQCLRRSFATEVQPQPSFTDSAATTEISTTTSPAQNNTAQWKKDGRLRPQRQSSQPIDPNHPLYAFFRKDTKESSSEGDEAPAKYLPFEPYWAKEFETGRPWTARELRRKSFQDLHVLWYVLARERNLLATQRQTVARYGMKDRTRFSYPDLDTKCRTTMARIKQVLNERRLAYLGASKLLAKTETAADSDVAQTPVADATPETPSDASLSPEKTA